MKPEVVCKKDALFLLSFTLESLLMLVRGVFAVTFLDGGLILGFMYYGPFSCTFY
jgi:hypothetical protein